MNVKEQYQSCFELIVAVMALEEELRSEMISDELTDTLLIDRSRFEEQISRLKASVPKVMHFKDQMTQRCLEQLIMKMNGEVRPAAVRKFFTENEIFLLKERYSPGKEIEMAELLDRPISSIWTKVHELGLR